MSLAITNNSISATPNAKSSDKTTLVDSVDNAEEQGFFDKLKSAIYSENTEENQKVEGKKIRREDDVEFDGRFIGR